MLEQVAEKVVAGMDDLSQVRQILDTSYHRIGGD
jgi:hypothetical protein